MATVLQSSPGVGSNTSPTTIPMSHPFTCNSCQVAFRSSEAQRTHMRSDWHRYNLKRRVASLPPLSSEVFAEKVLTAQASSSAAAAKASFEKTCSICQKTYFSENAYQNHLGSQKHKQRVALSERGGAVETGSVISSAFSLGEPIETAPSETQDPEAEEEFSKVISGMKDTSLEETSPVSRRPSRPHHSANEERPEHPLSANSTKSATPSISSVSTSKPDHPLCRCLFCNYESPTWKLSVAHMEKFHGLFVPEQSYLVDLEGLIRYLYEKITENHECILCHKIKGSTAGIQTHMRDKGHCMIAFDTEEEMVEVGQFYDFSGTYSNAGDDDGFGDTSMADDQPRSGGVKLPLDPKYKTTILDANGEAHELEPDESLNDNGWETDSSASFDSAELTSVPVDDHTHQYQRLPLHRHHSHTDPRPHRNADGFHAHLNHHGLNQAAFYSDYELHLPNGRTLGHRSLARYYRQNLHNYPTPEERASRRAITLGDVETDPDAMDEDEGDTELNPNLTEANDISSTENRLMRRGTRHLGLLGATTAQRRAVAQSEKRDRKQEDRIRRRYQWGNEKRANMQKHFRDPLLQ